MTVTVLKTKVIKLNENSPLSEYKEAAELILNGDVVGMPTETVYGLAGNAFDDGAVKKIFEAKGRPQDNPLIVHISEFDEIYELSSDVPESVKKLAERFWPGPLTVIVRKSEKVPLSVTAGLDTVAVRCPSHPVARAFIKACGVPIAAPSANLSGKPSPTSAQHVFGDLNGRIPLIIDGGESKEGVESTVITLATKMPRLLRPGNVTIGELRSVLGEVLVDDAVLNPLKSGEKVSSPGMKYKHYSPNADVTLVKGEYEAFCEFVNKNRGEGVCAMVFNGEGEGLECKVFTYGERTSYRSLSGRLFDVLRELDECGMKECFVRCPDETDDDLAVMNRLLRAAAFKVVEV